MTEKVIHIFGKLDYGGAELRTLAVSEHLTKAGHQIDYCCLSGEAGGLAHLFENQGARIYPLKLNFSFPIRFYRLLNSEKYTVVHSHVAHSSGLMLMIARMAGVKKRVAHYRSTGSLVNLSSRGKFRLERLKKLLVNLFATKITAVSKGTMESVWSLQWRKDRRCSVTYNGLDELNMDLEYNRYYAHDVFGLDYNSRIILHVGNMTPAKNHLRLLNIFKSLRDKSTEDYKLIVVGRKDEPIFSKVSQQISALGLDEHIHVVGKRDDVMQLMYSATGLLHPSLWEGLPGTILEAALMDLPSLATNLSGVEEIAEYFPCIFTQDLTSTDDEWSLTLLNIIDARQRTSADNINERLSNTPFSMKAYVTTYEKLWQ